MEKILKKAGWESLLASIVFAVLGILLITHPEGIVKAISYVIGILLILIGLYKVIIDIKNRGEYNFYNYDMAYGFITAILGIIVMVYGTQIGAIFRVLIGIWIIYSSIIRMNISFKLKDMYTKTWIYSLIIAVLMLICGIYTVCTSGIVIATIGALVLIYAVLDIIESIIFLSNVNKIS